MGIVDERMSSRISSDAQAMIGLIRVWRVVVTKKLYDVNNNKHSSYQGSCVVSIKPIKGNVAKEVQNSEIHQTVGPTRSEHAGDGNSVTLWN